MPIKILVGGFNFLNLCPTKNFWLCSDCASSHPMCESRTTDWQTAQKPSRIASILAKPFGSPQCFSQRLTPQRWVFSLPIRSKHTFLTDRLSEISNTLIKCTTLVVSCQKKPDFFCFTLVWNEISLLHPHGNTLDFNNAQNYSTSEFFKSYIPCCDHNMLLHQLFRSCELTHHHSSIPLPIHLTSLFLSLGTSDTLDGTILSGEGLPCALSLHPLDGFSTTPSPPPQQLKQ